MNRHFGFRSAGDRYIAINDNVDTENAESNDLMPFKNLFNEWFIRDTSRKIRAVLKAKAERGERLGTRAPYGYRKDPDTKKLIVDEEAAAIVRRIFAMCAGGSGRVQGVHYVRGGSGVGNDDERISLPHDGHRHHGHVAVLEPLAGDAGAEKLVVGVLRHYRRVP